MDDKTVGDFEDNIQYCERCQGVGIVDLYEDEYNQTTDICWLCEGEGIVGW